MSELLLAHWLVPADRVALEHWTVFGVFVAVMLVLDLTVFHRHAHEPTLRESFLWTVFWCSLALAFNILIWYWLGSPQWSWQGHRQAGAFLIGYIVEWSLSMDNVFVFLVIFNYFSVPLRYQYRVLFWGILGAVVMRLTFITAAAAMIHYIAWIMWLFGAFLVYTGIRLAMHHEKDIDPEKNVLMKLIRRLFPVAEGSHGDHFFVRSGGRLLVTQLFLVLIVIESTDVMFAVDSVPAIFGVVDGWLDRNDPAFTFIVFSSNVFAILGLRALYFLLAGMVGMFRYLSYGLSAVLTFVGLKMIVDYWAPGVIAWLPQQLGVGHEHEKIVLGLVSLVVVISLLAVSIIASLWADRNQT